MFSNHFDEMHFEGAINIPIEELDSEEENVLYMEIPADRPVILHCRLGMIVPGAYNRIKELRPDIPEISYIDGKPLFEEYNEWLENETAIENIGTEAQKAVRVRRKQTGAWASGSADGGNCSGAEFIERDNGNDNTTG